MVGDSANIIVSVSPERIKPTFRYKFQHIIACVSNSERTEFLVSDAGKKWICTRQSMDRGTLHNATSGAFYDNVS